MKVYTEWVVDGNYIDEDFQPPENAVGFIYKIFQISTGRLYIGKKSLSSTRRKVVGKRALKKALEEATDKRRVKKIERVVKDSDWRVYNSSCKPLQDLMKESRQDFNKVIIHWCYSKKHLSYMEEHYQHKYQVLLTDSWNDNIGGRYFKTEIQKYETGK